MLGQRGTPPRPEEQRLPAEPPAHLPTLSRARNLPHRQQHQRRASLISPSAGRAGRCRDHGSATASPVAPPSHKAAYENPSSALRNKTTVPVPPQRRRPLHRGKSPPAASPTMRSRPSRQPATPTSRRWKSYSRQPRSTTSPAISASRRSASSSSRIAGGGTQAAAGRARRPSCRSSSSSQGARR